MSHYPYSQQYPSAAGVAPTDPAAYAPASTAWNRGWFAVTDAGYLKGLLLGAAVTYLMTNPKVQRAMVKGAVALWTSVQGGVEEVKEQIQDIKAEMSMQSDADADK